MTFALAFTQRLNQLGLSRRELMRRSGLSRQTLHHIEHGGRTTLKPPTMQALDKALHWHPGTTAALCRGDFTGIEHADEWVIVEREGAYRWRIVQRMSRMSLQELEKLEALMEGANLGSDEIDDPQEAIHAMERRIMAALEQRIENVI